MIPSVPLLLEDPVHLGHPSLPWVLQLLGDHQDLGGLVGPVDRGLHPALGVLAPLSRNQRVLQGEVGLEVLEVLVVQVTQEGP